jgi:hypothetical protein
MHACIPSFPLTIDNAGRWQSCHACTYACRWVETFSVAGIGFGGDEAFAHRHEKSPAGFHLQGLIHAAAKPAGGDWGARLEPVIQSLSWP